MNKLLDQLRFGVVIYIFIYLAFTLLIYLISVYTNYKGLGIPLLNGKDDGVFYYEQALNFYYGLPIIENPSIHILMIGWLMKIFNYTDPIIIRIYNYVGTAILLFILLLIIKRISNSQKQYYVAGFILCVFLSIYPSLLVYNVLSINRDVWIFLFFMLSQYLFINIFIKRGKYPVIINLIFLIFSLYMLGEYRHYALLSFILGTSVYLSLKWLLKFKVNIKILSILILALFSVFYTVFKDFTIPIVGMSFNDALSYRNLAFEGLGGASQMNISLSHSNIFSFYFNYAYSILSNALGPFPWQLSGTSSLILMLTEGLVFIIVAIVVTRKLKAFSNVELFLFIQSIVWFMLIAVTNDNFGTGSRLRILGWIPLIVIFSKYLSVYFEEKYLRRKLTP